MGNGVNFQGGKAFHSIPSDAKVGNERGDTATPTMRLEGFERDRQLSILCVVNEI